jgi:hypothetical protein
MVALCFAHLLTITAWLEVRVLPTPPRSPAQTEISRFSANSPELAAIRARILSLHSAHLNCGGRFGDFVSALENCVSRPRGLALVETRFEYWVSATESYGSAHSSVAVQMATWMRSGARKASEIVTLTLRTLQPSRFWRARCDRAGRPYRPGRHHDLIHRPAFRAVNRIFVQIIEFSAVPASSYCRTYST